MKDALKKYIEENREAFDSTPVPDKLWDKIQSDIPSIRKSRRIAIWRKPLMIAATISVLLISGILIKNNATPSYSEEITLADINPFFAEQVLYQENQIETRFGVLKEQLSTYPSLDSTFTNDIEKLQAAYNQLHQQIQEVDNPEDILRAMIENLSFQMRILSDQLSIIQQLKRTSTYETPI